MIKYRALGITVLNLSIHPQEDGIIIPALCHIQMPEQVPVYFEDDINKVGHAFVQRKGNKIVADFHLISGLLPPESGLSLLQKMAPSVVGYIRDTYENMVTHFEIVSIAIGSGLNDPDLPPFGDRLFFEDGRSDLH